ncbi:hypothetical protein GGR51DRAFT_414162 [Nemania sp. FL0031]|nr:hypothetical protein GGR51DRAFT_414162 [Nemania sp. FL0031]
MLVSTRHQAPKRLLSLDFHNVWVVMLTCLYLPLCAANCRIKRSSCFGTLANCGTVAGRGLENQFNDSTLTLVSIDLLV